MGKSTGAIVVALAVGAAIGFVGGRASRSGPMARGAEVAAGPKGERGPAQNKPTTPPGTPAAAQYYNVPVDASQPQRGPADAKVTIVEVSDFECPFCSRVGPTLKKIEEAYKGDVRIVWANNPLGFHARATPAAVAALAAHEQGKFWEMHDKMFAEQKGLTSENFEKWAQELGLDLGKFNAAIASGKYEEQVKKEQALVTSRGARGTPAFFINGRFFSGAQPFEKFKEVIDEELKRADAELARGTPKTALYAKLISTGLTAAAPPAQQKEAAPAGPVYVEIPSDIPTKGPANAKVTIVEFTDFECPFCSRVGPTKKQILEAYPNDVRIAVRQLPLPFHKNAHLAGQAYLAAAAQGKGFEMHDKLFANQKALGKDDLLKYGGEIGLDMKRFTDAIENGTFKARMDEEAKAAAAVGARGTPAFFINGTLLSGAQPFEKFKEAIDKEILRADAELKKGTPPDQLYARLAGKK